jgi:hypothetical protein
MFMNKKQKILKSLFVKMELKVEGLVGGETREYLEITLIYILVRHVAKTW